MPRAPTGWHVADIKAALQKKRGTLRSISVSLGYNRCAVSLALSNPRYSRRLECLIAGILGEQPHVLWPDRWAADGSPVPRDGDHSGITTNSRKSCQKEAAA